MPEVELIIVINAREPRENVVNIGRAIGNALKPERLDNELPLRDCVISIADNVAILRIARKLAGIGFASCRKRAVKCSRRAGGRMVEVIL